MSVALETPPARARVVPVRVDADCVSITSVRPRGTLIMFYNVNVKGFKALNCQLAIRVRSH